MSADPDIMDMIFGDVPQAAAHAKDLVEGAPTVENALLRPEPAAIADAQKLAAGVKKPPRTMREPFKDRPWQEQFADIAGDVVGSPNYSRAENIGAVLTGNLADEAGAAAITGKRGPVDTAKMGPELDPETLAPPTKPNVYAAGSEEEDIRRTLDAEKGERDRANPSEALQGSLLGGAAASLRMPAGRAAQALTSTAMTGADMLGRGGGDLSDRAGQAWDMAKEHPILTGAAVGIPLVAPGIARGAEDASGALEKMANRNTVAAFTTPAMRTRIIDNSRLEGNAAIEKLGGDVRKMGLHKEPWYNFWKPGFSAETLYKNAAPARQQAEQALERTESSIKASGDPRIDYKPVIDDIEGAAGEVSERIAPEAPGEADYMKQYAGRIREKSNVPNQGPAQGTFEQVPFDRDYVPSAQEMDEFNQAMAKYGRDTTMPIEPKPIPKAGPVRQAQEVGPGEWADYLNSLDEQGQAAIKQGTPSPEIPEGPMSIPENRPGELYPKTSEYEAFDKRAAEVAQNQATMTPPDMPTPGQRSGPVQELMTGQEPLPPTEFFERPFSTAQKDLRDVNRRIDHSRVGGYEGAQMKEQVARRVAGRTLNQVESGLDDAIARGEVDPKTVADWKQAKKDYGVAASVEDPAMSMMQREYGNPVGLRDLALLNMGGPAAVAGGKGMQGRWPGTIANSQANMSSIADAVGKTADAVGSVGPMVSAGARSPIMEARADNPGAPKNVVVQKANDSLKEQLQEALKAGTDWFSSLLD